MRQSILNLEVTIHSNMTMSDLSLQNESVDMDKQSHIQKANLSLEN